MPGGSSPQRSAGQFIFRIASSVAPYLAELRYSSYISGAAPVPALHALFNIACQPFLFT
jgi:hypothetical protein